MKVTIIGILLMLAAMAGAQNVGIKSNLANDALLNPNIGAEVQIAPKWSVELTGELKAWIKITNPNAW